MDTEAKTLMDEVRAITHGELVLNRSKLIKLLSLAASQASASPALASPDEGMQMIKLACERAEFTPDTNKQFIISCYEIASEFTAKFKLTDGKYDERLAYLYREQNNYWLAGVHYERAADLGNRVVKEQHISFAVFPDWSGPKDRFVLMRESIACYDISGRENDASNCYYRMKTWQLNESAGRDRLRLFVSWAFWGWGEKPWRLAIWALSVIFLYGLNSCSQHGK